MKMTKQIGNACAAMACISMLTACGSVGRTGASPTLAKYTDAQITRCQNSLTLKEQDEVQRNARAKMMGTALIPFVGVFMVDGSEEMFVEAEKICKRKGIL